jgi:ABC-type sugar transport system ATPase subunit
MNNSAPIIEFRGVTKQFPGVLALCDISLDLREGELLAICGENGAGKSTLMKILSGVITDYQGEILLRGRPVRYASTRDAEAAGVAIIHQELNLVEELSAAANIFLGREMRGPLGLLNDAAMQQSAGDLLKELECDIDPRALAGSLRVGDQQLIEIAKALSLQTEILIMDEPTSALTESEVERLYRVVAGLRKRGVTILYISHKMDEVFHLADRITVLRDGQLVQTLAREKTSPTEITHLMVGREIEEVDFGQGHRTAKDVVLEVKNLSLPWPGHARAWRLKDVNLTLRRGEIVGIAGLMGAGRTELLECLFGASALRPTGEILLNGSPVSFSHPAEAMQAGIALVTEDRKRLGLFQQMNVGQNITICTLKQAAVAGLLSGACERDQAQSMVDKLAVKTAGVGAAITSLSGGNQQKTIIGRWLLTHPQVLLLDDPTRGVDVGGKAELYRLMDGLCRAGLGILLTSSELPELLTVSDRILVLAEGRLTAQFTREEATEHKIMEAATLLGE